MENEHSNEEPLRNEKPTKKGVSKDKRASVLKQLDSKKLYPMQERIGIYVIAVLSTIGLVLIGYTGVMAIASNTTDAPEASTVDAEEVYEMLDDFELEDEPEDDVSVNDDFETNHEYVEPEEDEPETAEEDEPESETEEEEETPALATGTIINGTTGLRGGPGNEPELLGQLDVGTVVEIIDTESNPFWARVSVNGLEGYVDKGFLDID